MMVKKNYSNNQDNLINHGKGVFFNNIQNLLKRINWGSYGVVAATILIWVGFNIATKGLFLSPRNISILMVQGVVLGIVSIGIVLVMVSGLIDLSLASTVGLSSTIAAFLQAKHGWETPETIFAVILIGLLIGAWQGLWISYVGIPAFIVTLAGMSLFRGAAYLLSKGQTYAPMTDSFKFIAGGYIRPSVTLIILVIITVMFLYTNIRNSINEKNNNPLLLRIIEKNIPFLLAVGFFLFITFSYKGIPVPVFILTVMSLILNFIANRTRYGRHLYAIGGNREAAELAGINIRIHILTLFLIMGVLYAISGIVLASRVNGAPPDPALFLELDAITACIIGGTSLFGGVGTVQGAILGVLLLTSLNNGMDLMGVSTFIQFIVKGLVLLLAVLLDLSIKKQKG